MLCSRQIGSLLWSFTWKIFTENKKNMENEKKKTDNVTKPLEIRDVAHKAPKRLFSLFCTFSLLSNIIMIHRRWVIITSELARTITAHMFDYDEYENYLATSGMWQVWTCVTWYKHAQRSGCHLNCCVFLSIIAGRKFRFYLKSRTKMCENSTFSASDVCWREVCLCSLMLRFGFIRGRCRKS